LHLLGEEVADLGDLAGGHGEAARTMGQGPNYQTSQAR
jgi:hypothetical protein